MSSSNSITFNHKSNLYFIAVICYLLQAPIKRGVDVAQTVPDDDADSNERYNRSSVFMEETPLNDHLFYAILAATPTTNFIEAAAGAAADADTEKKPKNNPLVVRTLYPDADEHRNNDNGNYLPRGPFKPEETLEEVDETDDCIVIDESVDQEGNESLIGSLILDRTVSDDGSIVTSASSMDYNTLISKRLDNVDYRYIDNDGLFPGILKEDLEESSSNESDGSESVENDESDVTDPADQMFSSVTRLSSLVARLCTQSGLDEQKYQCFKCRTFIGLFYGEFRVCTFDGKSYCLSCHNNATAMIPARVLYNWDLGERWVCDANKEWLDKHFDSPMLDIRATNPKLYEHVEELGQLKILRTQLLYLRAYLFTCRADGVANKLRQMLHQREHLHEHVHLYSVADLLLISQGGLIPEVQEAVCYARLHIRDCRHCTARGFLCELCNKNDVIFPFQLDTAQTCPECCAVFHRSCTRKITECPRCVRRKNRKLKQLQQSFMQFDDCAEEPCETNDTVNTAENIATESETNTSNATSFDPESSSVS